MDGCYRSIVFPASILILTAYHLNNKKISWKKSGNIISIITGSAFIIYLFFLILKHRSIIDTFILIFGYAQADIFIGSYTDIISTYTPLALFTYFIFPLIAVLYIICFIASIIKNEKLCPLNYL